MLFWGGLLVLLLVLWETSIKQAFSLAPEEKQPPSTQTRTLKFFIFQEPSVLGGINPNIGPNTLDTSTSNLATANSSQRKVFWDTANSVYWAFYNNGSAIEYSNSSNGSTWTSRGTTAVATDDFSTWYVAGTATVYLTYLDSGAVKVQKGTLSTTSISWNSPTTIPIGSAVGPTRLFISRDSGGKLWVAYGATSGGPCCSFLLQANRSTNADDTTTWDNAKTVEVQADYVLDLSVVAPLTTSGDMYFIWRRQTSPQYLAGRLWDDSVNGFGTTVNIDSGTIAASSAVSAATDVVHVAYNLDGLTKYAKYSGGSWGTPLTLDSNSGNNYAALSIDNNNSDNLYAFWIRSNTIYMKKGVSPYASGNWDSSATSLVTTGTNAYLTSAYRDGNNYLPFVFTEGTASPWNVRFYAVATGGGTSATNDFSIYIGEQSPAIKDAYIELRGVTKSGTQTLTADVRSVGGPACTDSFATVRARSFTIDSTGKPNHFRILYTGTGTSTTASLLYCLQQIITSIGTYSFQLKTDVSGTDVSVLQARMVITYQFTPPSEVTGFPETGEIVSPTFDTYAINGANFNWIKWKGTKIGGTRVRLRLATSNSSGGPWTFYGEWGGSCGTGLWYEPSDQDVPAEVKYCNTTFNNNRYFRYKVQLCSSTACGAPGGSTSSTVNDVIVNWSP